ncbi:MAG: Gldg family protein, partial [Verrucomicrobiota bacterium]
MAKTPKAESKTTPDKWAFLRAARTRTALLVAGQVVLMVVVFSQVNYLSCRRHTAWDLSQNERFSVSPTTGDFLGTLASEVTLVMAFLGSSDLYQDVKALVTEYDRLGGDMVGSEFLDLSRSRGRIEELRDRYQLEFSRDQILLIGESGRIKTISAEEMVSRDAANGRIVEFRGEEALTSAILEVTELRQRKVYLISGDRRVDELSAIAKTLQPLVNSQNARLEALPLEGRASLPEDTDVLIFAGNTSDLTARELGLVRDAWMTQQIGLLFMLDPRVDTPVMNAFLREHGVAPRQDRVMSVVSIPGVGEQRIPDVPVSLMPGDGPTRELPALSLQVLGHTQSLEVLYEDELLRSENIRPSPLMLAADGFWGESEYQGANISYNPDLDFGQPVFTAASVVRGRPGDVMLSEGASRLVVIGNPDIISPSGNSDKVAADFVLASINWVMSREQLIGISPRRPTAFTLNISPRDFGLLQTLIVFLLPAIALMVGSFV